MNLRKKLNETKHFQVLLMKQQGAVVEPDKFDYYLSAYLSASRSITSYVREQCRRLFDSWESSLTTDQRRLHEFMWRQRNEEVHRTGASVQRSTKQVPAATLQNPEYGFVWFNPPPGERYPEVDQTFFEFEIRHGHKQFVVETCEQYTAIVQNLVEQFDKVHGATS